MDDDARRQLRADLDAAIGPTPHAPDRMRALSARYDSSHRRHAFVTAAASIAVVAAIVTAAIAVAVSPGRSGHQVGNKVAISPTPAPPSTILESTAPTSPAPMSPTPPPSGSPVGPPAPQAATPSPSAKSTPPTRPQLQGTVVDEAGRPLQAIYVTGFEGATRTDARGRFIAPTSSGRHGGCLLFSSQPLATAPTGRPTAGDLSWQQWSAPSGDCADEITADIRVTMHPGADVFGTVRDSTGVGVAGVTVYSTLGADGRIFLSSSCCGASFAAVTDRTGHYRIYGQQPGRTMLALRQPWYIGGGGGLGHPATAGGGAPTDLTDYGPACDSSPTPPCANAPPDQTASPIPGTTSPPTSPSP